MTEIQPRVGETQIESIVVTGDASNGSSRALADILNERQRQVHGEGWTPEHDDQHEGGALASAAACYAHHAQWLLRERKRGDKAPDISDPIVYELWPFDEEWWKPKDPRRDLVRAGALIVAEIERIDRAEAKRS